MKDLLGEIDEEGMYRIAINQPLDFKIEQAIKLIQCYERQALELSPDGYYVCFSGGKDSIVMAKLFEMAGVKYGLHYNNVTIDPPELVRFLKREYPQAIWHSVGKHLTAYMVDKSCGPPTRLIRWCCEVYKEQGGNGKFKAIGVRAEESARRKGMWKNLNNNNNGGLILCPIVYWTDADVWQFIAQYEMKYCELYDQGYTRLGCVGCPMSGPTGMARDFARWPKYEAMWKRGFQRYFEKYKGVPKTKPSTCPQCRGGGTTVSIIGDLEVTVTCLKCDGTGKSFERAIEKFPTWEALWEWWISGKAYEGEGHDCQLWLW